MKDEKSNKGNPQGLSYSDLDTADKALVERAISKGFSRREALSLIMMTGVTLATAQNLLSTGGAAIAQTPKKGGSVRAAFASHGPDDQLEPQLFTTIADYARGRALYNGLCQFDNALKPQPELAESFEPNSNATEWTFKIRKGVVFHDGTPLTADDVMWSMTRHLGEDSKSVLKSVLASVKEWKKLNSHTVKAIMHTPNADLPALLSTFQAKIVKNGTTGGGMGTGPFVMESFQPGVKSISVRNENYWREGANLDSIEITAITDDIARVNALVSGSFDMVANIDPKAIRQIEEADGVSLISIPAGQYFGICALKNTSPGSNGDFVKGLQYIQDRERIVKRILKGHGSLGNDQPIMKAYGDDWCSEIPQRQYDPDKAKFHFKKSGVSEAELHVASVAPGVEDTCLLAQANCAKIGFDLKLKKVPNDGYWGSVWMKEPLNVTIWNMRSTANALMSVAYGPDAKWNDSLWKNDRMGDLLNLSLSETDPDKRHVLQCEMQTLIHEESGMIIPAHTNILDGISDRVKGMPTVPLSNLGGAEFPEFIWVDS